MKFLVFIAIALACALAVQNTAQSTMQTSGPADVLIDHLTSIQSDIQKEEFEHTQLYNQQMQECEEEEDARSQAISEAEDALARANAHHARCEAAHAESEADLAQVRAYQTEIDGILQGLALKREQQAADYEVLLKEELGPAIEAVQGAYPIIDSFAVGDVAFIQVTKHMGKTFKSMVKAGKGASMAAPLAALAEMAQAFNQQDINNVRDLFKKLEADLVAAVQAAKELEATRIEVYNQTVQEYNTILANLSETETQLVQYSAEMEACVVQESQIIDQAQAKYENNDKALAYAVQMCSAFESEYKDASAGRKTEIKLLEQLIEFIQEQADIFGDYGADSSGVFETYQSEYQASLEAQVQEFIALRKEKNKDHNERMQKAINSI